MCEKCVELDKKIAHYRRLSLIIIDQQTIDGINKLIEKMRAEKVALHSNPA